MLSFGLTFLFFTFSWAFAIAFIKPSHRLYQGLILCITAAIAGRIQYNNPDLTGNSIYNGLFLSWVWILHLRTFDLLFWTASGVYLDSQTASLLQKRQSPEPQSPISRLLVAWSLIFNLRNVNTPWAIKNLSTLSRNDPVDKGSFVTHAIAHALGIYLSLDAIFTLLPPANLDVDIPEYKQKLFSRISDVSFEEMIARPFTVIIPAISIYGVFSIPYDLASIIAVQWCNSSPRQWPPLFGSLGEAYTLRRFWG